MGMRLRERQARLTVGYIPGWVDDGNTASGRVSVNKRRVRRVPGRVHPSPLVQYEDLSGHSPGTHYDYMAEFRGIQKLRRSGQADVELHGYTHFHADSAAWAKASDRYEGSSWFRDFSNESLKAIKALPAEQHPIALGMAAIRQYFNVSPTTLIIPGFEWSEDVLIRALDLPLRLVSDYYLALRVGQRFCWCTHVCTPRLEEPDSVWFRAGLPVVAFFHDRDIVLEGVDWLTNILDRWQGAGARRLTDFRDLAALTTTTLYLDQNSANLHVTVANCGAVSPVRPISVFLRCPGRQLPASISVSYGGRRLSLGVERLPEGHGFMTIPPSENPDKVDQEC